ncbi:MAG: hypothetical protein WD056_00860 [Gemmatimonadota bacterium]
MLRDNRSLVEMLGLAAGSAFASLPATAGTAVRNWARSRSPTFGRLARGAAAGAAAAGIVYAAKVFFSSDEDRAEDSAGEVVDELLAGAGRGILYAALLQPYLPGPSILRGTLAGTADYLATPYGGLFSRLQEFSPVRRVPVLSILLETGDSEEGSFLTFVLHGALLGVLYGEFSDEE